MAEALAQRQQPHHPHRVLQAALMNMKFDPQLGWVSQQQQPMVSSGAGQKRSYKKKKKSGNRDKKQYNRPDVGLTSGAGGLSSDEDLPLLGSGTELEEADDGPFAFRRKRNCQYMAPLVDEHGFTVHRGWPWEQPDDGGAGEPKYRYVDFSAFCTCKFHTSNFQCTYTISNHLSIYTNTHTRTFYF